MFGHVNRASPFRTIVSTSSSRTKKTTIFSSFRRNETQLGRRRQENAVVDKVALCDGKRTFAAPAVAAHGQTCTGGRWDREENDDAAKAAKKKGEAIVGEGKRSTQVGAAFTIAAATTMDKKMVALITQSVASFIKLYLLLLFVRVLLTWFPNVNWMRQPFTMLRQVTDPYLNLFRNLIPPIMGQIDFTPILGFMVLQFLARVLSTDPSLGRF